MLSNVNYLKSLGALNVQPIHYPESLRRDFYTTSQCIKGKMPKKVHHMVNSILQFHKLNPEDNIALINHSGGAAVANQGILMMKQSKDPLMQSAYSKIVSSINIAPATVMKSSIVAGVSNLMNTRDIVPYLNVRSLIFGAITGSITRVSCIDAIDHHGIQSLDYKKDLEQRFIKLNTQYKVTP